MSRVLAPVPIAVICAVLAVLGLLAYGLAATEADRDVDEAPERGTRETAPRLEVDMERYEL
jgi:hypothetical protein